MNENVITLDDKIINRMRYDTPHHHVWETTHLAMPFLDHPGHVPVTADAGYRRVLAACHRLKKNGLLSSYTVTMNANVWWLRESVREVDADIPF